MSKINDIFSALNSQINTCVPEDTQYPHLLRLSLKKPPLLYYRGSKTARQSGTGAGISVKGEIRAKKRRAFLGEKCGKVQKKPKKGVDKGRKMVYSK